jgi:hypothetical protein
MRLARFGTLDAIDGVQLGTALQRRPTLDLDTLHELLRKRTLQAVAKPAFWDVLGAASGAVRAVANELATYESVETR